LGTIVIVEMTQRDIALHISGAQLFANATFLVSIVIPVAVVLVVYRLILMMDILPNHLMEASSPLERARIKRR
jgi:hypothetical protein